MSNFNQPQNRYFTQMNENIVLNIWVDPNIPGLRELYTEQISKHNESIRTANFPNSGFDLFVAYKTTVPPITTDNYKSEMIKFGVKCEMYKILMNLNDDSEYRETTAYLLTPRSSMSQVPLIQSNHIGLIDCGYRGEIKAPVRNLIQTDYVIEPHTRLFQLWHPCSFPFTVVMVDDESELSSSERGEGGFGSSGIVGVSRG
jgi:dUTP pyrophosphatase